MQNVTMHTGWPAADYFAVPAASASFLKAMKRSPYHAQHRRLNPPEPSAAMRFGTAWHTAFFEPHRFALEYAIGHDAHGATKRAKLCDQALQEANPLEWLQRLASLPEGLGATTKEGRALVAELEAVGKLVVDASDAEWLKTWVPRLNGRTIISADDDETLAAMLAAAKAHPVSRKLFGAHARSLQVEVSMFADVDGVPIKARPDLLIPPCKAFPGGFILDGKTTGDASAEDFARSAWNMDYHLQAAIYTDIVQAYYRTDTPPTFAWLASEKEAPHCCAYYTAGENLIEHGRREYRELLRVYGECERTGIWPGYSEDLAPLVLPAWAERAITADNDGEDIESISYAA